MEIPILRPPLAGRSSELEFLRLQFDNAVAGRGGLVLITGEAGIGKSRLTEEFGQQVTEKGSRVMIGRCIPGAPIPYLPFQEALKTYFQARTLTRKGDRRKAAVLRETGLVRWLRGPREFQVPDVAHLQIDESTFYSTLEFLRDECQKDPILFILEDLHWADSASIQLLHFLARNSKDLRILLIGTYRPEDLSAEEGKVHPLQEALRVIRREGICQELTLSPLNREALRVAFEGMLGGAIDSELLEKIEAESEGNPLFAVETVRLLVQAKSILLGNGKWEANKHLSVDIPTSVREVIMRRVERLSGNERRIINCAAVVGERFDPRLLENTLGLKRLNLLEELASLERNSQLISASEGIYRFSHEKVQRVVYEQISPPLRRELHKITAQNLEQETPHEKFYGELSLHFHSAEMVSECIKYSLLAGHDCLRRFALNEAIGYFERALSLSKDESLLKARLQALEGLGDANAGLGQTVTAISQYESFLKLAQSSGERARILVKSARLAQTSSKKLELLDRAEKCVNIEPVELGRIKRIRGNTARDDGRANEAERLYLEAEAIFERNKATADLARTLLNHALLLEDKGMFRDAIEKGDEASRLYSTIQSLEGEVEVLGTLGSLKFWLGSVNQALDDLRREAEIGAKLGNYSVLMDAYHFMGVIHYHHDEFEASRLMLLKAREYASHIESLDFRLLTNGWLARAESRLGMVEDAEQLVRLNLEFIEKMRNKVDRLYVSRVRFDEAELLAAKKEWAASLEKYRECLEFNPPNIFQQIFSTIVHIRYAEALARLGRKDEAREQLLEARRKFETLGNKPDVRRVDKLLEELM